MRRSTRQAHHELPAHCLNCCEAVATRFCGACGQENEPATPSFSALINDLWQEFLQLDGKVLRTLRLLIVKPGFLSAEYVGGRRIRYVSPFRLYFWATTLFVVLFFKLNVVDQAKLQQVIDKSLQLNAAVDSHGPTIIKKSERRDKVLVTGRRVGANPSDSASVKHGKSARKIPGQSVIVDLKESNHLFDDDIAINSPSDLTEDGMASIYSRMLSKVVSTTGSVMGVPIDLATLSKSVPEYEAAQSKMPEEKRDAYFAKVVTERAIRAKNNPYEAIGLTGLFRQSAYDCSPLPLLRQPRRDPLRKQLEHPNQSMPL